MSDKLDLSKGKESPQINEGRRALMRFLPDTLSKSKAEEGSLDEIGGDVAKLAEKNGTIDRREILALPFRAAAAAIIAKIAFLLPKEADAYSVDNFTREIFAELDPSQITTKEFELLDNLDIPRPLLYFQHNVRGKIEKNGVNVPTPSVVFESAKFCWRICKEKLQNIETRRKILAHLKDVAAQGHRDAPRIMKIHETMTRMDEANMAAWKPLVAQSYAVVKQLEALVSKEESAAKSTKAASPAQDMATFAVPLAPRKGYQDDFDNYAEVLRDTRPDALFTFECGKLPVFNNKPRPQTSSTPTEAAFLLRNFARIYFEAAVQRHKACENIEAVAELIPDKKTKAALIKAAHTKTSKPIRDAWGEMIREELSLKNGKKGPITELVKGMVNAARGEMERSYEIDRCAPEKFPTEEDYLLKATGDVEKTVRVEEEE